MDKQEQPESAIDTLKDKINKNEEGFISWKSHGQLDVYNFDDQVYVVHLHQFFIFIFINVRSRCSFNGLAKFGYFSALGLVRFVQACLG